MLTVKDILSKKLKLSIWHFVLLSCTPWIAVFWHSVNPIHQDDGPAALLLLTVSGLGTVAALAFYSVVFLLLNRFWRSRYLMFYVTILLCTILTFCMGSSLLWAKVAINGEVLFGVVAGLYVLHSLKMVKDLIITFRLRKSGK